MQRRWWIIITLVAGLALIAGCGGAGDSAEDAAAEAVPAEDAAPDTAGSEAGEESADEGALAGMETYRTEHDPDAVYTYEDIPERGNYIKVNLEGLDDDQVNRVVHRLRTETCHCVTCDGITIDECLVTRTQCGISVKQAASIVGEEKRREN